MPVFRSTLDCLAAPSAVTRPVYAVRPAGLAAFTTGLTALQCAVLDAARFDGAGGSLVLLPGTTTIEAAVIGLGENRSPDPFGKAASLPAGDWRFAPGDFDPAVAVLGFCLGAYRFDRFRGESGPAAPRLVAPPGSELAVWQAEACWLARDLINMPANHLGPVELAGAAHDLAILHGAEIRMHQGAALAEAYPALAAVGAGSDRPPMVAELRWGAADRPLVSLCGKGVCFDTGGYDIKPSSNMLRMKKDMGGAAVTLGLAHLVMRAKLPVRLVARIGCVENSISGRAMRPLDVLRTRRGLQIEVGNTDAEGRLVLADLLAEASDENPAMLFDFATLTGAARAALGPELPALFANDDALADALVQAGQASGDPLWRLPLWDGYDSWLKSPVADLQSVSGKPFAGAVVAALFLRRFVRPGTPWAHIDAYCWNDTSRPGHPEGGEAQALRASFAAIRNRFGALPETETLK